MSRWTIDGCQLNEFELDDVNGDILRMAADSLGRIIVPDHLDNKVFIVFFFMDLMLSGMPKVRNKCLSIMQ